MAAASKTPPTPTETAAALRRTRQRITDLPPEQQAAVRRVQRFNEGKIVAQLRREHVARSFVRLDMPGRTRSA